MIRTIRSGSRGPSRVKVPRADAALDSTSPAGALAGELIGGASGTATAIPAGRQRGVSSTKTAMTPPTNAASASMETATAPSSYPPIASPHSSACTPASVAATACGEPTGEQNPVREVVAPAGHQRHAPADP